MVVPTDEVQADDIESLIALAVWKVRRFKTHKNWEDVECEARLAALLAIQDYNPTSGSKLTTWVAQKAEWHVSDYLRTYGPLPYLPGAKKRGEPQPEVTLYLEDLKNSWWGSTSEPVSMDRYEPRAPDFVEEILEEAGYDQMWADLVTLCTPRQLKLIYQHIICGEPQESIALREGVCFSRVSQIIRDGLDKYRSLHDIAKPRWKHKKNTGSKDAKISPCRPTRQSR